MDLLGRRGGVLDKALMLGVPQIVGAALEATKDMDPDEISWAAAVWCPINARNEASGEPRAPRPVRLHPAAVPGVVRSAGRADPRRPPHLVARHHVTHTFLPPTLIYMVLADERLDGTDLSSLQCFWYGAAPMSVTRLEEALTRIGPVMAQLFGQTEAPMMVSTTPWSERPRNLLSAERGGRTVEVHEKGGGL
ncbi:MAG: AMP-binding protein [Nocardioidaceae bacterium]